LKVRQGSIFVEAVVAITVVLMAMGAVAQLIAITVRQRRQLDQMFVATQEASNVMERLYGSPWNELADRNAAWHDISHAARSLLQEPQIHVEIETSDEAIRTKRCRVEVTWLDQSGQRVEPVQLTAWKHLAERQ
jgi:hypothetical protein